MSSRNVLSLGLLASLLLSTTVAAQPVGTQPKRQGEDPVSIWPSGAPAGQVSYGPLLGILGIGAAVAALAGGGGDDAEDTGASGGPAPDVTDWLDGGPGREPDSGYAGEVLTLLKRTGFQTETFLSAIRGGARADAGALEATLNDPRFQGNPALRHGQFANKIALGLTGAGVKVGVYDTGIVWSNRNLRGVAKGPGYATFTGADLNRDRHGTQVANVLAGHSGASDARGVAPGVEIHDIRVVTEDTDTPVYTDESRAGAFDYIINQDLDIVNISLVAVGERGGDLLAQSRKRLGDREIADFRRATENGTVFVVSAGNEFNVPTVNAYGGIALDPSVGRGQIVTVYSLSDEDGTLSEKSNTCGQVKYFCIGAVGEALPVINHAGKDGRFAGTSAASPVFSGALAIVQEEFPEMSPAERVELLLFTATDMGETGVDDVYGRGALNMDRAVLPVGGLRVVTGQTVNGPVVRSDALAAAVSPNMLALAAVTEGKTLTALDGFNRGFEVAAEAYVSVKDETVEPISVADVSLDFGPHGTLRIAGEDGVHYRAPAGWALGFAKPEVALSRDAFVMRRGYTPLAHLDRGLILGTEVAGVEVSAHTATAGEDAFALWAMSGTDLGDEVTLSYGGGLMHQEDAFLDTDFGSGSALTGWATVSGSWAFAQDWTLTGEVTGAHSRYEGGALFSKVKADAWAGQVALRKDGVFGGALTASVGVPLTVRSGTAHLDLPGDREVSEGEATTGLARDRFRETFRNGLPVDFGLSYAHPVGETGMLAVSVVERDNPDRANETFAGVSFSMRF